MSDWQVGDLALCIDDGPARYVKGSRENADPASLVRGRVYTVLFVGPDTKGIGLTGLAVTSRNWGWFAERFIKVTPPAADEFDREVIEQMNSAPVGEPVA